MILFNKTPVDPEAGMIGGMQRAAGSRPTTFGTPDATIGSDRDGQRSRPRTPRHKQYLKQSKFKAH
jgi:hypothetical protein